MEESVAHPRHSLAPSASPTLHTPARGLFAASVNTKALWVTESLRESAREPSSSATTVPEAVVVLTAAERDSVLEAWVAFVGADRSVKLVTVLHQLGIDAMNDDVAALVQRREDASVGRVSLDDFTVLVGQCKRLHMQTTRCPAFRRKDLVEAFSALSDNARETAEAAKPPAGLTNGSFAAASATNKRQSTPDGRSPSGDHPAGGLSKAEVQLVFTNFSMALDADGLLHELDTDHNSIVDFNELINLLMADDKGEHKTTGCGMRANTMRGRSAKRHHQRKSVAAVVGEGSIHGERLMMSADDVPHHHHDLQRFVAKNPVSVTAFYRALQKAATNVAGMDEFRSRCGKLMAAVDRQGEPRRPVSAKGGATAAGAVPQRPTTAGGSSSSSFARLASDNRQRTVEVRRANKSSIEKRQVDADVRKEVVTRDRKIRQTQVRLLEERLGEVNSGGCPTLTLAGLSRLDGQEGGRRRAPSTGSFRATSLCELDELPLAAAEDNNSIYSTSSSQRSMDGKAPQGAAGEKLVAPQPPQASRRSVARRESSAPVIDFGPGHPATPAGAPPLEKAPFRGVSMRMRSLRQSTASAVAGTPGDRQRAAAAAAGDRKVLSAQVMVRTSANTNQLRTMKIGPPPAAVADALRDEELRRKQLPPSLITARTRLKQTLLSNETKLAICKADDYGEERLDCDAKLYECYFGKT